MATLILQTAGSLVGGLVGGPVGAALGGAIGGAIGGAADAALLTSAAAGRSARKVTQGPRLKDLDGISATEGAPIPRLYGRARLGGQVIWATRLEEEAVYSATRPKGGKGGLSRGKTAIDVSYRYHANIAVGLCEGPIAFVRRVWADGKPIDLTEVTMRLHPGTDDQAPDPLIVAKQGAGGTPAYRGLAYVVFERLPLETFGNRLPQFTFEVVRPVHGLCRRIRAVNIIPGAGEYVYEPEPVSVAGALGASRLPNRTQLTHPTNWHASLDALQALCPNLAHVALVVSWFGDDLRAGACRITPRTEPESADADPHPWSVAGLTRATAQSVSLVDGVAAFGGTPSDGSVIRAIRDLTARGLAVTLYPFVMMDVPKDNARPDPWTGAPSQPAYPWRGRITCDPAPGRPQTADGTAAAEAQVAAFAGRCTADQFSTQTDGVVYAGPADWSLRRLVLHTAALGRAAGGVDSLVIGSELVGLTRVRGTGAVNPAVAELKALAAEARAIVGPATKITYGADWTEYGAEARDGGSDLRFPLDPLWSDETIDAVALDWYPPVTDWRDGAGHADAALYDGPHDIRMFAERAGSGEGFDWYYADDADRVAQTRRPIADGAAGRPWVFRPKDLVSWWSSPHFERTGGVEQAAPTAWVPGSKPIWLLELGCPAVDRAGNGPNVFPDPKSSTTGVPPASRGVRDDLTPARLLTAALDRLDPAAPDFAAVANPPAALYAGRMVDPARIYLWAWDARPFPAFPAHTDRWADAANFDTGHWLNGRVEGAPMDDLLAAMLADAGFAAPSPIAADGFVEGYVVDRPMSLRAAIEPLASVFGFDALVTAGRLRFVRHLSKPVATLGAGDFAEEPADGRPALARTQDSELPTALTLGFVESDWDHRQAAARAAIPGAAAGREAAVELAAGLQRALAIHRTEVMLNEARVARDSITFALPPSRLAFEPGDLVGIGGRSYRLQRIVDGAVRHIEAVASEPAIHLGVPRPSRPPTKPQPALAGPPLAVVLDLAAADGPAPVLQRLAVAATPWPGAYIVWRSAGGDAFEAAQRVATAATVGETKSLLRAGPLWRLDRSASVELTLSRGALQSVPLAAALEGANLLAIGSPEEGWEIVSFLQAELLGAGWWRVSGLIRGLAGSEPYAALDKPAGRRVVVLDGALVDLAAGTDALGRRYHYRIAPEGRDHADPLAVAFAATAGPEALLPLAPVGLRARREAGGVRIGWIRRTRFGGDNWEIAEAPLNEEREAYVVEIMAEDAVRRRFDTAGPELLYEAAAEAADFGGPQAVLPVRVAQLSAVAGRGRAAFVQLRVA
jgi:hypothetical protein